MELVDNAGSFRSMLVSFLYVLWISLDIDSHLVACVLLQMMSIPFVKLKIGAMCMQLPVMAAA